METNKFFYKYPKLLTVLFNIHYHIKELNYDFPLIMCGDTGNGKTMLNLHILELYLSNILGRKVCEEDIRFVHVKKLDWLKNFKNISACEMNINDEAADGLTSKQALKRFGRDLEKVYNVFRKKRFFTIITIPDFFDLPPYFRKRVRGLIYCEKRGRYKYYSKLGIMFLNVLNSEKSIKSMNVARPLFTGVFPDYTGVLRKPYDAMSMSGVDSIIDEVIEDNVNIGKLNQAELFYDKVKELLDEGLTYEKIREITGVHKQTISNIKKMIIMKKL